VTSESVFRCPADAPDSPASYALNDALRGIPLTDLANAHSVPAIYDSPRHEWNAADRHPEPCDPPRHAGVNIAAMCDGSAGPIAGGQVLPWPRLLNGVESQPSAEPAAPRYSGPSLLFQSVKLGLKTEYPHDWTATERSGAVRFAPRETSDTWVEIARDDGPAGPPQPATAARSRITLTPRPGAFPVERAVEEYDDGGAHCATIRIASEPPLLARLRAPAARWEEMRPALLLPVTALRLTATPP
jgi:hypothetical protein